MNAIANDNPKQKGKNQRTRITFQLIDNMQQNKGTNQT